MILDIDNPLSGHDLNYGRAMRFLAGYEPFSGSTNWFDLVRPGFTGILSGSGSNQPAWTDSNRPGGRGALDFAGGGRVVTVGSLAGLGSVQGGVSFATWIYARSTGNSFERVVTNADVDPGISYGTGTTMWWSTASGQNSSFSGTANAWHRVVGTWDGATRIMYVDGRSVHSAAHAGTPSTPTDIRLGNRSGLDRSFSSAMDDATIWLRVLSPAEVLADWETSQLRHDPTLRWIRPASIFLPLGGGDTPVTAEIQQDTAPVLAELTDLPEFALVEPQAAPAAVSIDWFLEPVQPAREEITDLQAVAVAPQFAALPLPTLGWETPTEVPVHPDLEPIGTTVPDTLPEIVVAGTVYLDWMTPEAAPGEDPADMPDSNLSLVLQEIAAPELTIADWLAPHVVPSPETPDAVRIDPGVSLEPLIGADWYGQVVEPAPDPVLDLLDLEAAGRPVLPPDAPYESWQTIDVGPPQGYEPAHTDLSADSMAPPEVPRFLFVGAPEPTPDDEPSLYDGLPADWYSEILVAPGIATGYRVMAVGWFRPGAEAVGWAPSKSAPGDNVVNLTGRARPMKIVRTGAVYEDSSLVLMCRIKDTDDALPTASAISSITITVFDLADKSNKIAEVSLTAPFTGNWFDALQTGTIWRVDDLGYNFKYVTDPAHLPNGDRVVRFDAAFVFSNGAKAHQSWDVPTLDLKRS